MHNYRFNNFKSGGFAMIPQTSEQIRKCEMLLNVIREHTRTPTSILDINIAYINTSPLGQNPSSFVSMRDNVNGKFYASVNTKYNSIISKTWAFEPKDDKYIYWIEV